MSRLQRRLLLTMLTGIGLGLWAIQPPVLVGGVVGALVCVATVVSLRPHCHAFEISRVPEQLRISETEYKIQWWWDLSPLLLILHCKAAQRLMGASPRRVVIRKDQLSQESWLALKRFLNHS